MAFKNSGYLETSYHYTFRDESSKVQRGELRNGVCCRTVKEKKKTIACPVSDGTFGFQSPTILRRICTFAAHGLEMQISF